MKEIRKIIEAYDRIDHKKEKLALASVVNIEESSYRRIGARMLVSSTGNWIGGISGGCLEGDALRRSQQAIFENKVSTVTYDTLEDDENQIGVGLGCNGKIDVLFTPINPEDENNPIEQLRDIATRKEPSALIKVIKSESNNYLGRSRLLDKSLSLEDFCEIDPAVLFSLLDETKLLRRPQVIDLVNAKDEKLSLLIEYLRPETKLILVGDNYDVISMVSVAEVLGWEVTILCRKKKLAKEVYQKAKYAYEYEEMNKIPFDEYSAIVFMTHDYNWDKKLLPEVIDKDVFYIGMLGPKKRLVKMENDLSIKMSQRINFFSPVGLDIGAETPEEIAISIASEILATMRERDGTSLKFRKDTIHPRVS